MKKIMDWLSDVFAPAMQKITQKPWVAAVSAAMQKNIPFIMTGSVIYFYGVFREYLPMLPDLGKIADYTFGMIAIITAFMVTNQVMEKLRLTRYTISAALVAVCVFMIAVFPVIDESFIMTVSIGRFGPSGILVGIIVGLFVAIIFNLYAKLKLLKNSEMPDFVIEWIHIIIPTLVTIGIATLVVFQLQIDIFDKILLLFSPIESFGQTLPGFILLCLIPAFFYSMGISSWLFGPITTPIYMAGITANVAAVAAGMAPTQIVTSETVFTAGLITMGGMGATLALNVLMIRSKSKKLSTLGKICIMPSIFNINEPVVFGAPIVMNPMLMVPMWINAIVGPVIVWIVMRIGLLNIPAVMNQLGQIPAPISTVMITGDWRGIPVYIVLFIVYLAIWYPFFKVYEKTCILEEQQ